MKKGGIILDARTEEMVERLLRNSWFGRVGIRESDAINVKWVDNWRDVSLHYLGTRFENYKIDAVNRLDDCVRDVDVRAFNEETIPVAEEINRRLQGRLISSIDAVVPYNVKKRREIVNEVESLVIWACNESYWASRFDVSPRAFLEAYKWFVSGHMPCGGVERYPGLCMYVY